MKKTVFLLILFALFQGSYGQKITITQSQVSSFNAECTDEPWTLFDGNQSSFWQPCWEVNNGDNSRIADVIVDTVYSLSKIRVFDYEGVGTLRIFAKVSGGSWSQIKSYTTSAYNQWVDFSLTDKFQYLRFEMDGNGCRISEIEIYATPTNGPVDPTPNDAVAQILSIEDTSATVYISGLEGDINYSLQLNGVDLQGGSFKTLPSTMPTDTVVTDTVITDTVITDTVITDLDDLTFEQKIGVNAVLDHPMSDLQKFDHVRLYLFSQDWSKSNEPNNIHINPLLGFGGSYSLVPWIQNTGAKVMVSMRNNPEFTPVADGPSAENLGNSRFKRTRKKGTDKLLAQIAGNMERPPSDLSLLRWRILQDRKLPGVSQKLVNTWLARNETLTRSAVSDFPSYMYVPANYQKHAHGYKMLHDALVQAGVANTTQAIGLGNEFEEHWKNGGDWPPEAQAALLTQADVAVPKSQRLIDVGLAGHVAPDYRQLEREAAKYIDLGLSQGYYPGDYIQLHWYYNQSSSQNWGNNDQYKNGIDFSNGALHPEGGSVNLRIGLNNYKDKIDELWPTTKPYLVYGEWGWDIGFNDASDQSGGGDGSPQIAYVQGQSNQMTQAQWTARADMQIFFSKTRISYQYFYDHVYGGGGGWLFGSCGLVDANHSQKMISYYFKFQQQDILNGYKAESIIQEDGNAYIYRLENDEAYIYVAWSPTASQRSVSKSINIGASQATKYTLNTNSLTPSTTTVSANNGSISFTLTETPTYFKVIK